MERGVDMNGLERMPLAIQLWAIQYEQQALLACSKIKKERIDCLIKSYFDLLVDRRRIGQSKRLMNCRLPLIIEKE